VHHQSHRAGTTTPSYIRRIAAEYRTAGRATPPHLGRLPHPQEKLAAARSSAAAVAPAPVPAATREDVGRALREASEAFTVRPAVADALAPGLVRLRPGVSAGETVMVTGADGAVGKLVVELLLLRCPGATVRAVGDSLASLEESLSFSLLAETGRLELVATDLLSGSLAGTLEGVSAVVWCASSFGRRTQPAAPEETEKRRGGGSVLFEKALELFLPREASTDLRAESGGVRRIASAFKAATALLKEDAKAITPKFVLLSSAAVTRPTWDAHQRTSFGEAYDIPIVGLNPGDILGYKCDIYIHI